MKLIVGLGNPGKKFRKTRHNIGRITVNSWQKKFGFADFKFKKKFNALISKGRFNREEIILALPETFMNLSGKSVKPLTTNYKLQTTNLFVVHDDLDLPLGKIRISVSRGSAGHKGVQSIIDELGTKNFVRFRIGIKPKQTDRPVYSTKNFVLEMFNKSEEKAIKKIVKKTCQAIEIAIKEGIEKAMQEFNQ